MKIAIIASELPTRGKKAGGVSVVVDRLATALVEAGHVVRVISFSDPQGGEVYEVVPICPPGWVRSLAATLPLRQFAFPWLLRRHRIYEDDIRHFHGFDSFWFGAKPWVRTMHGSSLRESQFTNNRARKLLLAYYYLLEISSARRASRLLCIGSDTVSIYGRGEVAPNPVSLSSFSPGEKASVPTLLYVGYWSGRKRGEMMYRTFVDEILPVVPEARLVMVADRCPDHPNVELRQGVSDEELAALYRKAWLFTYPSAYEGFGVPYIEAMASGTPVVTTVNPGARDVLQGELADGVVEDTEFGREIVSQIRDSDRRNELARVGMEVARNYSTEEVVRFHEDVYRGMIAERAMNGESNQKTVTVQ